MKKETSHTKQIQLIYFSCVIFFHILPKKTGSQVVDEPQGENIFCVNMNLGYILCTIKSLLNR